MNTEIFRFTAIRPPQQAQAESVKEKTILLFNKGEESDFVKALQENREAGLDRMKTLATEFTKSDKYIRSEISLSSAFRKLNEYLLGNVNTDDVVKIKTAINDIFQQNVEAFVISPEFKVIRKNLADSLLASMVVKATPSEIQNLQVRFMKIIGILEIVAKTNSEKLNLIKSLSSSFILPKNVFPLPAARGDLSDLVKNQKEEEQKYQQQKEQERKKLLEEIKETKTAFGEIQTQVDAEKINHSAVVNPQNRTTKKGFFLETASAGKLTQKSKEVVRKFNFELSKLDISMLLPKMEEKISELSQKLYEDVTYKSKVHRLGNVFVANFPGILMTGTTASEMPGPCRADIQAPGSVDTGTFVPEGKGKAKMLGIMDLLLVDQKLSHYEKGEIAHIENVLIGEERERKHRHLTKNEETVFSETESINENENSLASTERYELQVESQKVIEETLSFDAGVTANMYGVGYDVSASANVAGSISTLESNSSSSSYARDITSKAVSKITNRTLERRSTTKIQELEELNTHSFKNSDREANVSGIYRWIDKIYEAQVLRYGKRLLLEFVVPEPAAFFRYAMQQQPIENVTLIKPEEPGYCVGGRNFRQLRATDVTRDNYLMWANKYDVTNINPPPPSYQIVGESFASDDPSKLQHKHGSDTYYYHAEKTKITIPNGYYPEIAKVNFDTVVMDNVGLGTPGSFLITVQMEDAQINNKSSKNTVPLINYSTDNVPVSITSYNLVSYGLTITVFCRLSNSKYEEWQLKTYNAIKEAYNNQKAKYDEHLSADRIRQGMSSISGRNPVFNRETERTELKKNCITLLTGQRFDRFNAVLNNVRYADGRYGYPEIVNFDDANAEGNYIQFFEQAVEWSNMLYLFYPYFWAEKNQWVQLSQLSDNDALFSKFLQAGSARVQVPIRPGFEYAISTYLQTGLLWQAEGDFVDVNEDGIPDNLYVSILDELKEGILKPDDIGGEPVGEKWNVRVPTSLVIIENNAEGLFA